MNVKFYSALPDKLFIVFFVFFFAGKFYKSIVFVNRVVIACMYGIYSHIKLKNKLKYFIY